MTKSHRYLAIDELRKILKRIPESLQWEVYHMLCVSVGISIDRRIPLNEQKFGIEELITRLVQLTEEVGLWEEFLVMGICGYVDNHLRHKADPWVCSRNRTLRERNLERFKEDFELPIELRNPRRTDEELSSLIDEWTIDIENAESRRHIAANALKGFRLDVSRRLTVEFWDNLALGHH